MESRIPINLKIMPIVITALVSTILIISQSNSVFAGTSDGDYDGYPSQDTCGGVNCDPDDNDPCNPNPNSQACLDRFLELVEDVEDIVGDVEELVDEGTFEISMGQLNSLVGKLEAAADKIESAKFNAAIGQINAFINQINAFINSGQISSQAANGIITDAQNIINILS